jgi:hypothetical protein
VHSVVVSVATLVRSEIHLTRPMAALDERMRTHRTAPGLSQMTAAE